MQAAVICEPLRTELQHVELPEPGPGELRVRLEGCGVCGSNVPVWEGRPWFHYPLEAGAPGHEGWGVVDRLGSGVFDFAVGDRVALLSDHAFAEYDIAQMNRIARLPAALDSKPFPAEPLACAMNVFARSEIKTRQNVAIVGIGFLGALLVQLAAQAGANVTAISRRTVALEFAERFGAAHVHRFEREDTLQSALSSARIDAFDCVIEAVGAQETLDLAAQLTRERGRLVIAGYHQDGPRQVDMQMWNWRGFDVINAHERNPETYVQ